MIVWAVVITFLALIFSGVVAMANGMRASPGPFQGAGVLAAVWISAALMWLAWWLS